MKYPKLNINQTEIYNNAKKIIDMCANKGIETTAVIKGFNAEKNICDAIVAAGYKTLASSRIEHLKAVKKYGYQVETLALRIPMASEVKEIIQYCDISLNSEIKIIEMLNNEAKKQHKKHKVILMRDLGDLREGIINAQEFCSTAIAVEQKYGSSLFCMGNTQGWY